MFKKTLWESRSSYDRRSVGQYVLASGHHLGLATNFSFTSMRFPSSGVPCLTRGRVCNLSVQLLLGLVIAVAKSKCRRTRDHILLPH
jgi:hypothetical protein